MIEGDGTPVHILQATPATLSAQFESGGAAVDPGTVTVTITRRDGTALTTDGATTGTTTGPRLFALTAAQTAALDELTAVWSGTVSGAAVTLTTRAEIVGDLLFTVAAARAFGKASLADGTKYPEAAIIAARSRILDDFARITGVAFVPRSKRVTLSGDGTDTLRAPDLYLREIVAIDQRFYGQAGWTALSADDLAAFVVAPGGVIQRTDGGYFWQGRNNYRITYTYGYDRAPEAIRRAALTLATYQLVPSDLSDRVTSQTNDVGTFRLAVAGWRERAYYGLPTVDAVLARYDETVPGIG